VSTSDSANMVMVSVNLLWDSPSAVKVIATGTFDNWCSSLPLTKGEDGVHRGTIRVDSSDKLLFKFIVDGEWRTSTAYEEEADAREPYFVNNVMHPSSLAELENSLAVKDQTCSTVENNNNGATSVAVAEGLVAVAQDQSQSPTQKEKTLFSRFTLRKRPSKISTSEIEDKADDTEGTDTADSKETPKRKNNRKSIFDLIGMAKAAEATITETVESSASAAKEAVTAEVTELLNGDSDPLSVKTESAGTAIEHQASDITLAPEVAALIGEQSPQSPTQKDKKFFAKFGLKKKSPSEIDEDKQKSRRPNVFDFISKVKNSQQAAIVDGAQLEAAAKPKGWNKITRNAQKSE